MGRSTFFCVQPFLGSEDHPEPGKLWRFTSAVEAEEAFELLKGRVAGLMHYEISGDPEFDVWDEPVWLGSYGELPYGMSGRPVASAA